MLSALKRHLFSAAHRTGVVALVAGSRWRRRRLMILCYHGVSLDDEHEWHGDLYVSQARLRERFAQLRREGYHVIPLDEGVRRLADGTLPPRAVALTFDDGTYDFHARALPVLREFGYPATAYVATYYTSVQLPVFDPMVAYLAWKGQAAGACAPEGLVEGDAPLGVGDRAARAATVARLRSSAARLDAHAKDALARRFAERLGVDYDALVERRVLHLMTPAELAETSRAGVDVQLHTHRHRMPEDRALFLGELADNRRALDAAIGDSVPRRHFCYPSGEYASAFVPWLHEGEVATATTCDPGLAAPGGDPLRLPRFIDTMGHGPDTFRAWVSGLAELLPRRTRRAALARG